MPVQGYVLGWWQQGDGGIGEAAGVTTASRYGKTTVCTVGAENLSVHSGLEMPSALRQKPIEFGDADKRIYVSFLLSDGDNFSMDLYSVIERAWHEGARGKVPLGWVRHWYETASANDLFVCMDGLGYIYPTYYGQALGADDPYGEFLGRTGDYMRELDMRHLWFLGGSDHVARMVERLRPDGLFGEYGVPEPQRQEVLSGTAAIWVDVNPWEKPYDTVDAYVQAIRKRTPATRPAFLLVGVNGFCVGPDKIAPILRELGPDYVAVRPDELCHLFRTYRAEGVNPNPRPRAALDLSTAGSAPFPPARSAEGWWVVDEVRGTPDIGGWFTAPGGTAWVRKRVAVHPVAGATEAAVRVFVSGKKGRGVVVVVNGHEHRAELPASGWQWLRVPIPIADIVDGDNEIRYSGNPDGRLGTAGYSTVDFEHSDFGAPDHWASLDGELACIVDMR
jgi:hypothetical protein